MDLKLSCLVNAISAAKELGLSTMPWVWLKYMQSGWEIKSADCDCGGKWIWLKPHPSGIMDKHGCVCHHELELSHLVDTKFDAFLAPALKGASPSTSDVGKIFYTFPGSDAGTIISRKKFVKLDPADIGWWVEVDDLDI